MAEMPTTPKILSAKVRKPRMTGTVKPPKPRMPRIPGSTSMPTMGRTM